MMGTKGKKVLILGNGFDLAHGLPTRYSDFLEFCSRLEVIFTYRVDGKYEDIYKVNFLDGWKISDSIKDMLYVAFKERDIKKTFNDNGIKQTSIFAINKSVQEIHDCLTKNIWYDYLNSLYKENKMKGENWIDFESEVRYIIHIVDQNATRLSQAFDEVAYKMDCDLLDDEKWDCFCNKLNNNWMKITGKTENYRNSIKDFREKSFTDLERLTRALELYLSCFVEKLDVDIRIKEITDINPDYIISFNYTNTYERLYKNKDVFHIHGRCIGDRVSEQNNMVLGIDEYWSEDERDCHTNFTIFKKFAQRIRKKTGIDNYKYLNDINRIYASDGKHWTGNVDTSTTHTDGTTFVYIFGHSLDVTDKDILVDYLNNEATAVTVYCKDKGTEGELIANVIQIIGEKRLLEKANQAPTKIEFKIQECF